MISADTSSLIQYLKGKEDEATEIIDVALAAGEMTVSSVVICELLSDPKLPEDAIKKILSLPQIEITYGYWQRAGINRSKLIAKKLKTRLADSLIAQSCIDHKIPLISHDKDFRHFEKYCGLKLIKF